MTIQDVKQIKLADYLQSLGYTPVKQQGITCGTNHRYGKKRTHRSR